MDPIEVEIPAAEQNSFLSVMESVTTETQASGLLEYFKAMGQALTLDVCLPYADSGIEEPAFVMLIPLPIVHNNVLSGGDPITHAPDAQMTVAWNPADLAKTILESARLNDVTGADRVEALSQWADVLEDQARQLRAKI